MLLAGGRLLCPRASSGSLRPLSHGDDAEAIWLVPPDEEEGRRAPDNESTPDSAKPGSGLILTPARGGGVFRSS